MRVLMLMLFFVTNLSYAEGLAYKIVEKNGFAENVKLSDEKFDYNLIYSKTYNTLTVVLDITDSPYKQRIITEYDLETDLCIDSTISKDRYPTNSKHLKRRVTLRLFNDDEECGLLLDIVASASQVK